MSKKTGWPAIANAIAIATQVSKLPGSLKVIGGLMFFLVAAVWGWIERKNPDSPVRALGIVSSFFGIAGFLYIGLVAGVLLFQLPPSAIGTITRQDSESFRIDGYFPPNRMAGEHKLTFASTADCVQITVAPTPKEQNRITELRVTAIHPPSIKASKVVRSDPKEDGVLIEQPTASASADFEVSVTLAAAA